MTGIRQEIDDTKRDLQDIKELLKLADKKKGRKPYKIPFSIRSGYKRKQKKGEILVFYMKDNHSAEYRWEKNEGGNINIEGTPHAYDHTAIYFVGNIPIMPIFSWRMTPAGGEQDKQTAKEAGDMTDAGRTIIRGVEAAELAKLEGKKKKGKGGIILLIIGVIIVVYLLSQGLF